MSVRRRLDFSKNWNGKLLNDVFTTIRAYNYEKYEDTALFEVWCGKTFLGTAELVNKRGLKFRELSTPLLWVDTGHDEVYAKAVFHNMYKNLTPDAAFYLLVFKWRQRTKEGIHYLLEKQFENLNKLVPELAEDLQPTLFKD